MRKIRTGMITAAAAAMLCQGTVMAAPLDELNEILAAQSELKQESLLSETLGLKELQETIKENGIAVHWKGGLTDGTAEVLNMQNEIPEGIYAELGFQLDRNAKNWKAEAGFGTAAAEWGSLALYGAQDTLQLAIPQLYEGSVALHAGNLKEQYEASALPALLGEEYSAMIPDLNVKFYPEASDLEFLNDLLSGLGAGLTQELEGIEDQISVEKKGDQDEMIYTMTCPMEAVKDVYASFFDGYIGLISQFELMEITELSEFEQELNLMLEAMFTVMPEEINIDFYVEDSKLAKIAYELEMDTAALEAASGEVVEDVLEEAGTAEDAAGGSDAFQGTVAYELIYADPSNPAAGMDIHMKMTDEEVGEYADFLLKLANTTEATTSVTTVSADVAVAGQQIYTGTLYTQSFDAATGDFDFVFAIPADSNGLIGEAEAAQLPTLTLDSTFTEIDPGKSFAWKLDGLTVSMEGVSAGITSELTVNAQPEAITDVQPERALLELDENELSTLIMEVYMNAQNWLSERTAEMDALTNDSDIEESIVIGEDDAEAEIIIDEAEDDTKTVSIIGGADGPTSIFLAGKVS